jgi:triacylglycerol esterase/lipase EstA (alpha/beta hydrolase family)
MTAALRALVALAAASGAGVLSVQLIAQLAAWRNDRARPPCAADDVPSAAARARAVLRETLLSLALLLVRPFGAGSGAPGRRRVIVLVHGFGSSPGSLRILARRLRREGWTVRAPRLGWWRDLAAAADRLAAQVEDVRRELGGDVAMVAHGVGGLAARALLQRAGAGGGIRWLITLGTPHGGTSAFPWFRLGPFRNDVRPGSHAMRALGSTRLPAGVEAVAIASPDDAILVPPEGAHWPDACNVSVQGSGHLGLLVSARVYQLMVENLPERLDESLAADALAAASGRGD